MKKFYVCSFGGCGSYMLTRGLEKYGKAYHIHSRNPPEKLQYIGNENGGNTYFEWFNGKEIPDNEVSDYYVIYIYRNPIHAIYSFYSRFKHIMPAHLKHIQTKTTTEFEELLEKKQDLYGIEEFFDNYTTPNPKRNYKIYCVKYSDIFTKQNELSKLLEIGPLNLQNKETKRTYPEYETFEIIYKNLINKMNNMNSIHIV